MTKNDLALAVVQAAKNAREEAFRGYDANRKLRQALDAFDRTPDEPYEECFNLDQLHKMAIEQGVFKSRLGNTLTVSEPIRVPREPPHCPTCDCPVPGEPE